MRLKFMYVRTLFIVGFAFLMSVMCGISVVFSQIYERINVEITDKDGRLLPNTHAGGLKAPQFSPIDFNGDGRQDLFVFDRNADLVLPFIKTGEVGSLDYSFEPEYARNFPKMIKWALIRDYNGDNIPDIFTSYDNPLIAGNAVAVYKGTRTPDGHLSFELIDPGQGRFRNVLNYQTPSGTFNSIFVNTIDMPAILDLDHDGDFDIISFDSGGQYALYYKNLCVEEGLEAEAFKYVIEDHCWGKFQEAQFNDDLTLSDNPVECASGFHPGTGSDNRHSGTSLCVLDLNGDELYDMIIGDIGSSGLTGLINGGSGEIAHITQKITDFPTISEKAQISDFVAAYHIDIDEDNQRDLIVTTNAINNSENVNHVWYYKNMDTNASPDFRLIKKDFLIDQMPYFYSASHPVFADVDQDGLTDLVIGTNGILDSSKERKNRIVLLKNTGTKKQPQFRISDEDYLGFSQFQSFGVGRLAPAFGDLNGDDAPDLLVGTLQEAFLYSENTALPSAPYAFNVIQGAFPYRDQSTPLFLIQNIKPQILDANGDGLDDIVVGKANRQLNLFINTGTQSEPYFNMDNFSFPNQSDFGHILKSQPSTHANAAPHFFRSADADYMLLGTDNAQLELYKLGNLPYPDTFALVTRHLGGIYEGRNTVASVADINDDGFYEMVVGNERGGIAFYQSDIPLPTSSATDRTVSAQAVLLYPNPTFGCIHIRTEQEISEVTLADSFGRPVKKLPLQEDICLDELPPGMYQIRIHLTDETINKKVIIVK